MYNELSFLFDRTLNVDTYLVGDQYTINNNMTIWGEAASDKKYTVYKDREHFKSQPASIKNYIKENIYDTNNTDENPYISLLKDETFQAGAKRLKPSYFTYLRDLGVYPMNRMIILRRFPDGVVVRDNLDEINAAPIATVVGWVKEDSDIFNISFNEDWETTSKYLHEIISDILKNEFKMDNFAEKIIPSPGWSQGLVFGFFKAMGLVEEGSSAFDIPFGDPNLLREGAYRDFSKQTLKSSMSIEFDTVYEQKYVGDIDPATAMIDIIRNLTDMGTSDMRYVFTRDSDIIRDLTSAVAGKGNDLDAWADLITTIVEKFIEALRSTIDDIFSTNYTPTAMDASSTDLSKERQIKKLQKENENLKEEDKGLLGWKDKEAKKEYQDNEEEINRLKNEVSNENQKNADLQDRSENNEKVAANMAGEQAIKSLEGLLGKFVGGFLRTVLASTFAKHRWTIRGSIGAMTGQPTAPWHITIGNPYSPIISSGNMVVDDVSVNGKGEMGFNDMPKEITATIKLRFGRNLGKQEIQSIFNNGYKRYYSNPSPDTKTNNDNVSDTPPDDGSITDYKNPMRGGL